MDNTQITKDTAYSNPESEENQRETKLPIQPESTEAARKPGDLENTKESGFMRGEIIAKPENTGILSSAEDIELCAVDGSGQNYIFLYDHTEFSAQYTVDNWKIVDSYKITNMEDMLLICQALLNIHPVHGRDMQSIRTAEDMAFEWLQHNLAYAFLPEDSPWKQNAKDVDLNPSDQGRSFQEMYEARTGRKFRVEDFIG